MPGGMFGGVTPQRGEGGRRAFGSIPPSGDVAVGPCLAARRRAEQRDARDATPAQLGLVLLETGEDGGPVHTPRIYDLAAARQFGARRLFRSAQKAGSMLVVTRASPLSATWIRNRIYGNPCPLQYPSVGRKGPIAGAATVLFFARSQMTAESLNTENRNTQMLSGPERPIETEDQDALDRHQFVVRLARAVIDKNKRATGVVVGVTGAWGSGKSSVLNLLCNYLNSEHPEAVVVCFDPWLISGRNDLIAEFIGELISATQKNPKIKKSLKILTKTFATYGKHLAPVANVVLPGAGIPIAAGASIIDFRNEGA